MTGLRHGELVALRWRDVDWTAGVIRVRRSYSRGELGTPKSRRSSRAVPMADRVAAELERHFQRSAYQARRRPRLLPPADRRPLRPLEAAQTLLRRDEGRRHGPALRPQGGIPFHDLRHTFGTRMAAAGVPLRTIQEWMGHRDYTTTSSTPTTHPTQPEVRRSPSGHSD